MRSLTTLLWLLTVTTGCGKVEPVPQPNGGETPAISPAEPPEPVKLTDRDREEVERFAKEFVRALGTGPKESRLKYALDSLPTDSELEFAFPNHSEKAKDFYKMLREALPAEFDRAEKADKPPPGREIVVAVEIEDAREAWQRRRSPSRGLIRVLSPRVLVVEVHTRRASGSEGPMPILMKVNGRWTVLYEEFELTRRLDLPPEPDEIPRSTRKRSTRK